MLFPSGIEHTTILPIYHYIIHSSQSEYAPRKFWKIANFVQSPLPVHKWWHYCHPGPDDILDNIGTPPKKSLQIVNLEGGCKSLVGREDYLKGLSHMIILLVVSQNQQ